jgi:hypothetical protein
MTVSVISGDLDAFNTTLTPYEKLLRVLTYDIGRGLPQTAPVSNYSVTSIQDVVASSQS